MTAERGQDVSRGPDLERLVKEVKQEHEATLKVSRQPRLRRMAHVSVILKRLGFIEPEERN